MIVETTKHFDKRFSERIAKTKRVKYFAQCAYNDGRRIEDGIKGAFLRELRGKEEKHGTYAILYKNAIYWFCGNIAVTVYPLSQKMHKRFSV